MSVTLTSGRILEAVIDRKVSLDTAIDEVEKGERQPKVRECAYGCCRHYLGYDRLLDDMLERPIRKKDRLLHFMLIAGMYQLEHMATPDHAVVNETVGSLKKRFAWARKFVNGVLREFARRRDSGKLERSGADYPDSMVVMIRGDWPEHWQAILDASNQRPPLTLRVNPWKISRQAYCGELDRLGVTYSTTPDSALGVILDTAVNVEQIPGFSAGQVSIQDESAQLVASALDLSPGQRVLDGCAAPGGKTGLVLESATDLDVVAVDRPQRINAIRENLERLGYRAKILGEPLEQVAENWTGELFHRVLLDVPCSGTGVMRRHPDIRFHRDSADIERFQAMQLDILDAGWSLLEPGGRLLYVTCSVLDAENDSVIGKFTRGRSDFELQFADQIPGLRTTYGIQRLPGIHSGDGFYYSNLLKTHANSP